MKTRDSIQIDENVQLIVRLKNHQDVAPNDILVYTKKCYDMLKLVNLKKVGYYLVSQLIKVFTLAIQYIRAYPDLWKFFL
jgi:hypothetical protein